ncbi:baseplate J/gp47 family protein [Burkholderia multivorans]|uniref:baseplate J/gp47 family protein n=1 Tax=Burkholderia multivorans TaxID=87883 RepID=UPI00123C4623|nr:baseplate J/gp47 family protein [Burkholderia multivorans]MCO7334103.1 baseplate J/gp47 family protein [Burkholderia multivorans]MCO7341893.1 baseplate J/gp47 family protein [Burkholderia multivorans]MCO7347844.1 baseplate J/gp47 family protein [Burkholderia multivorans]QET32482.1 baseplate J/gp47 family protein [Burkholderia multivorans]QET37716.1 baseplate J/gp47 family protein [Burkholderia multivorans]
MSTSVQVAIPTIAELKDNAARQLQQGLIDAAIAQGGELSATDIALARSNIEVQAFVQGVGIHGAYRYLRDFIARQAIPTKAVAEFLDDWLNAYGLPRKEAIVSQGATTGSGVAGAKLAAGNVLRADGDLTFTVLEDASVAPDGSITPKVVCDTPGRAGNLAADTPLELVATVPGIDSTFKVGPTGLSGGTDRETDAEAIYRLGQRLANPPRGSAPGDYERWALSVPGITRAWGIRNPSGPTSAGVVIMADNNQPYGLPTELQRQAVYDYIRDPKRGPPDELFVIVPEPVFVDVVLQITPDTDAARDAIELELKDLFFREAVPHGRIPHTHLREAVSTAPGEFDHSFIQPVLTEGGFLVAGAFQILVLRSVAFR